MIRYRRHTERHYVGRMGWLRAAVLGANDGIVSTASLIMGVAAAAAAPDEIVIAGVAALVAGAMSMAAGEYVSVSAQADTEAADLAKERRELAENRQSEHEELTRIYMARGLDARLASEVSRQLMAHDALGAHARDELGISATTRARPIQAALASGASFASGAMLPLLVVLLAPSAALMPATVVASLASLALLGVVSARTGGAVPLKAAARVVFWGGLAMAATAAVGSLFGTNVL
ncbi:MAG: VIT family protein [Steroidobacteraceae bacterium]|nr:VIT family protein [Steroidobacteraceae bacterium]